MDRGAWWAAVCGTGRVSHDLGTEPSPSVSKESACNAGDWGRSPGEGKGNPLQYSLLENPVDTGAWWATVMLSQESDAAQLLNLHHSLMGENLGPV